jgi:hypothetical protein
MFTFGNLATVLRIDGTKAVIVWWNGNLRSDLIQFDDAGFKLMYSSLSMNGVLQEDVTRNNIKVYLNDLLASTKYNFDDQGPINLNEDLVKSLLGIQ